MREDFRHNMREGRERWESRWENRSKNSHIWTGIFILLIGLVALLRTTVPDFPNWVFTWQTFLVALGVFIGLKHNFRGFAWLVLILVGGAFLLRDFYPHLSIGKFIWPVVLMVIGAFIIFRPRKRCGPKEGSRMNATAGRHDSTTILDEEESWSQDDLIDVTAIFGGSKKNMLSKDFKGGDIVNIFGGTELNLSQADIKGRVELEITTIFGGTKLIVPANWEVKSEAVTIFGGLEDKRSIQPGDPTQEKILVLRGTVLFGGIEIKSF
ncbi:MAG: hypothetical protein KAX45_03225 [Chitinophagaceae bacterium]|nr:hypothetical protein [Chitinophagaceae bacterium]MBP8243531.1 hypothetical protein [Chitinophagaceae bacterium]